MDIDLSVLASTIAQDVTPFLSVLLKFNEIGSLTAEVKKAFEHAETWWEKIGGWFDTEDSLRAMKELIKTDPEDPALEAQFARKLLAKLKAQQAADKEPVSALDQLRVTASSDGANRRIAVRIKGDGRVAFVATDRGVNEDISVTIKK